MRLRGIPSQKFHSERAMRFLRHSTWHHWANLVLLAAEGLAVGIVAACVICCFRLAKDVSTPPLMDWLSQWKEHWWTAPLWLAILIAAARLLARMVRAVPLISGSGIPQTELVVMGRLHLSRHDWIKILPAKFFGCLISTLGGLSLGREGPCIQMGAATASLVSGLWEHVSFSGRIHIAAGAAAGMAAAFGAPVAGLCFVFEEMRSKFTWGGFIAVFFAVAGAEAVTRFAFGFGLVFPFSGISSISLQHAWLLPVAGVIAGVAGVAYNISLLGVKNAEARFSPLPQKWRILPQMLAGFFLAFLLPCVLGGGENLVSSLIEEGGTGFSFLLMVFTVKILFSLVSYTGNVPGGILMPMLCIGALLGALCGQAFLAAGLLNVGEWEAFIVYGMAGFFASMVRAPVTGTALVIEMSGALMCLPGAAVVAFAAGLTASAMRCPPVYDSLRAAIIVRRKK